MNIVIYGRQSNRFDQIYGSDFQYDPHTGDIVANGEVHIDLQGVATGEVRPDMAPPKELKNPIHVKTSGLQFNQKTGIAETAQRVDFAIPQANGSAQGARYDTKLMALMLLKDVNIKTSRDAAQNGRSAGLNGATILADSGIIADQPRQALLTTVQVAQGNRKFSADAVTIALLCSPVATNLDILGGPSILFSRSLRLLSAALRLNRCH